MFKKNFLIFSLVCLFSTLTIFSAEGKSGPAPMSAENFKELQSTLCPAEEIATLKQIGKLCAAESFEVHSEDLNGDGQADLLVYGPTGECGEHGNCPFKIFIKNQGKWSMIMDDWANSLGAGVLTTSHLGYRDLLLASDDSSFFWTKNVYQWNGKEYKLAPNTTTYFLVDGKGDLKQVTKARYESCSKNGKGCLN